MKALATWPCIGVLVLSASAPAGAADRWESGSIAALSNDDAPGTTRNELRHGDVQTGHDLEGTPGAPDRDFMIVKTVAFHSYEAVVRSTTLFFSRATAFCVPPGGTSVCPRFDRVSAAGTVEIEGVPDGATNSSLVSSTLAVRWGETPSSAGTRYLRVQGDTGGSAHTALDQYEVQLRDTTYVLPRFNNSATQVTILVLENTVDRPITLSWFFLDNDGSLLHGTPAATLQPYATMVLNTASLPALVGKSGSALVNHLGPFGALAGKAVSLEPATGFTFDTPILPVPY